MKIADIMKADVEVCVLEDNLAAAATRMWDSDVGCLPVVDESGRAIGMVTDRDVCMAALTRGEPLYQIPVSVAMSKQLRSCAPDATLAQAEEIMRSGQVRRLPVIDREGALVGIVSLADLARRVGPANGRKKRDVSEQEVAGTLAAICAKHGHPVPAEPASGESVQLTPAKLRPTKPKPAQPRRARARPTSSSRRARRR
jgi:CBS domain-containing protein